MPKSAVYVGRPSTYGNPYRLSSYRFEGFDHGGEHPPHVRMQAEAFDHSMSVNKGRG